MQQEQDRILMVVSYYDDDSGDSGIKIKSQLNNKELIELVEMINSILYAQDESDNVDLSIKENSDAAENIFGDQDLLKVDNVINGSIIDPLKK